MDAEYAIQLNCFDYPAALVRTFEPHRRSTTVNPWYYSPLHPGPFAIHEFEFSERHTKWIGTRYCTDTATVESWVRELKEIVGAKNEFARYMCCAHFPGCPPASILFYFVGFDTITHGVALISRKKVSFPLSCSKKKANMKVILLNVCTFLHE